MIFPFNWDRICSSLQYNLYNQYKNTHLLNLSLGCNCTAICAMSQFTELYSNTCLVVAMCYHSSLSNSCC